MKFSLPELALRRPVTIVMIGIALLGTGAIAAYLIPIEFMPSMDMPFLYCQFLAEVLLTW